jgi:pimeloyl-ACP methyl ester carboxylesterase
MRLPISCLALAVCAATLTGCTESRYVADDRLDKGLVLILPGIEGPGPGSWAVRKGLEDGALPYALEVYDWRDGRLGAAYAFDEPASRKRAEEIALHIDAYRRTHIGKPVFVVGHSGGGALAAFVSEAIDEKAPLNGVILMEPALSPEYDLTKAIQGAGGHFAATSAESDVLLRSLTTVGRNFDGIRGRTAGQDGFQLPPDAWPERRAAFEKVCWIRWDASMLKEANWGGHMGCTSPPWVASALAPIILRWAHERN